MARKKVYHFDVGNSNEGPIGFCARIVATSQKAAVERLRALLPEFWDTDETSSLDVDGELTSEEYLAVYFNPDAITTADIDFDASLGDG